MAFVLKSISSDISIATLAFLFWSICLEYLFPSLNFPSVYIFCYDVSILYAAYVWVMFSYPFSYLMFFDWNI